MNALLYEAPCLLGGLTNGSTKPNLEGRWTEKFNLLALDHVSIPLPK
jgi:hypothetical protein